MSDSEAYRFLQQIFEDPKYRIEQIMVEEICDTWGIPKVQAVALAIRLLYSAKESGRLRRKKRKFQIYRRKNRTERILEMEVRKREISKRDSNSDGQQAHSDDS